MALTLALDFLWYQNGFNSCSRVVSSGVDFSLNHHVVITHTNHGEKRISCHHVLFEDADTFYSID